MRRERKILPSVLLREIRIHGVTRDSPRATGVKGRFVAK